MPDKPKDITLVMKEVYEKVKVYFKKESTIKLTFEQLIPSDAKEDKVYTFIPLLHLDYARKIDIRQRKHFGLINIHLPKKKDFAELQTEAMDELATEN